MIGFSVDGLERFWNASSLRLDRSNQVIKSHQLSSNGSSQLSSIFKCMASGFAEYVHALFADLQAGNANPWTQPLDKEGNIHYVLDLPLIRIQ